MKLLAKLLFLICVIYPGHQLSAQIDLKGQVIDEGQGVTLENATVMLIQQQDSILKSFTRTDKNGNFNLTIEGQEDLILIVSFPKYADYNEVLTSKESRDFGKISLQTAAHLIEEVIVTGRLPVVIKGDTLEYDAGSFTVEKNAKVEELLKVLPGITVDASGKITAQGKVVEKVLVDGEEFFGTDPTLVTRNIRSDMVDKVQVYEKKSEQSERTGVDDGERIQTINVQLKEEAKNGMFGKVSGGVATDKYYMGQLMLNKFKGPQKIGAFLVSGNNGATGLSQEDANKFGDETVNQIGSGGQGGAGIPKTLTTGVNYNDKWQGDKNKISLSYVYGKVTTDGETEQQVQNNLEDRTLFNIQNFEFENEQNRHQFNMKYDLQIDSLTSLTIDGFANKNRNFRNSIDSSMMRNHEGNLLNTQYRQLHNTSDFTSLNINTYFTRKFLKEGRSVSLSFNFSDSKTDGLQYLDNQFKYFDEQGELSEQTRTDQKKDNLSKYNYSYGSLTYTEPLLKSLTLSLAYAYSNQSDKSSVLSYDKDADNSYSKFNELYSSNFNYNRFANNYNLALTYNIDKFHLNITNWLRDDHLKQTDQFTNDDLQRNFLTYNPMLSTHYNITKSSRIGVRYRGDNNLPSLNQIQPLRNNEDELNVYVGNEDLRPAFNNTVDFNYGKWNALKGSYIFLGGNLSNTTRPIVMNMSTDKQGRNTYKWENLTGKTNNGIGVYLGGGMKLLPQWSINLNVFSNVNFNNNYNYIDDKLNNAKDISYGITTSFERNLSKGLDFKLSASPRYIKQTTEVQPEFDNSGFTFNSENYIKYYLPYSLKIFGDVNYIYEAPTNTFSNRFTRLLISPGISKKFFKEETLEVSLIVNDLLNQNVGFSRTQNGNRFIQSKYDTIRRYYMLKVSWDINKMFAVK